MNVLLSAPVILLAAGAVAALFVVLLVFVLRRAGPEVTRLVWPLSALVVSAIAAVFVLDRMVENDRTAERRALEQRQAELTSRALAPGSMLGCLDSAAGDAVESACENLVFGGPQSVAAAVAYVTARLALLSDELEFVKTAPEFADRLTGLQRSIELDRFGIAAHVLASRDGCTPDRCAAFALLRDTSALKANLRVRAYNEYVARHAVVWNSSAPVVDKQPPVASSNPPPSDAPPPVANLPPPSGPGTPVSSRYDFPSAASIPPVSIMNAEPPLPPGAAAANAAVPASEGPPPIPMPLPRPQTGAPAPAAR
jgi:hypothetical protein